VRRSGLAGRRLLTFELEIDEWSARSFLHLAGEPEDSDPMPDCFAQLAAAALIQQVDWEADLMVDLHGGESVVYGEQALVLHRPLRRGERLLVEAEITAVEERGRERRFDAVTFGFTAAGRAGAALAGSITLLCLPAG
jgi:hypothetical protein